MATEIIISFLTLSLLEIVLGIDNLIFIALVAEKLPDSYRLRARVVGLVLALGIRVVMLASLSWVIHLIDPVFAIMEHPFSWRDLLLLAGGFFLIGKSTLEIHTDVHGLEEAREVIPKSSFNGAIIQIAVIDFVFSFDSIMTAIGIAEHLWVMVAAVVVSMLVMLISAGHVARLLREYPTFKMLALAFILMIGTVLVAEGMGVDVPKGYIYVAFAFSIMVELLNSIARNKRRKNSQPGLIKPDIEKLL